MFTAPWRLGVRRLNARRLSAGCFPGLGALVLSLMLVPGAAAQDPIELPPLDGDSDSRGNAINFRGQVAGDSDETAVIWSRKGEPKALLPLEGDCCSSGKAINARGEVLGESSDGEGGIRVVLWRRNGKPELRQPLPIGADCTTVSAAAINFRGEAVGSCRDADGRFTLAVFWDKDGNPSALPPLDGGDVSFATGINARGEVSGASVDDSEFETSAVIWDRMGAPRGLSTVLEAFDTNRSTGINRRGQASGIIGLSGIGVFDAVRWDEEGEGVVLERPDISDNCGFIDVGGINNQNEVVGTCTAIMDPISIAVLWDRSGTPILLPPLEGDVSSGASAISARGEIVGTSVGNESRRAVVWR